MDEAARRSSRRAKRITMMLALLVQGTFAWGLNVPNACVTVYDITAPLAGTLSSPGFSRSGLAEVAYSGVNDATGSGVKEISLLAKQGVDGGWTATGQKSAAASGVFSYSAAGDGAVYFALRVEDLAGNLSSAPGGAGMSSTVFDASPPVITLAGAPSMTIEYGSAFTDPGATAVDNVDGTITGRIVKTGVVSTSTLATFTIRYSVTDSAGNAAAPVTRTVKVVDTTKPTITLNGSSSMTVQGGSTFTDPGATARDNYDGEISSRISKSGTVNSKVLGSYTVTYTVSDTSGNTASATRSVRVVDTQRPVITLKGSSRVEVPVGGTYTDAGATAYDSFDGDITSRMTVKGLPIKTSNVGSFSVTYSVTDKSGNVALTVTRVVNVTPAGLRIHWPVNGSVWYMSNATTVPVNVTATTGQAVEYVQVTLDGQSFGSVTKAPYSVNNMARVTYGQHTIKATGKLAGSTSTISASATVTFAPADAAADADANGLPDNPFTALPNSGDTWYAATGHHITAAMNIDGDSSVACSGAIVDGSSAGRYFVPRTLCAKDARNILLIGMGTTAEVLFGADTAGFAPEPDGYMPMSGNRYIAASLISSTDGGASYSEPSMSVMAANPIYVIVSPVTPTAGREIMLASHPMFVDSDDYGVHFAADTGAWGNASADATLANGTMSCKLTRPGVVAAYERDPAPVVDSVAPTVALASPQEGDFVLEPEIEITGAVEDDTELSGLVIYTESGFGGIIPMSGRAHDYSMKVTLPNLGEHIIYVQAYDSAFNTSEVIAVKVQYGAIGDVNMDGLVDQQDAGLISQLTVTSEDALNEYLVANGQGPVVSALADINLDNAIDSLDVTLLRRALKNGKESTNAALSAKGMPLIRIWEPLPAK